MFAFLQEAPEVIQGVKTIEEQKNEAHELVDKVLNADYSALLTEWSSMAIAVLLKFIVAVIAYYICRWAIRKIVKVLNALMTRNNVEVSLASFLSNLVSVVLYMLVGLFVIQIMGFNTTSFVAIFASASLAVGMALSGTLQNFAGGVMILLLRPYKVGDYISAAGQSGTVKNIHLFTTIISTTDNQTIYIPNNSISTAIIDNYSVSPTRRVDISVGISYGDDFDVAKKAIMDLINADSRILKDPAPVVFLAELADSSVNLAVRMYVNNADYWGVFFDMNEKIYKHLPESGISFPFPQMDVHVKND